MTERITSLKGRMNHPNTFPNLISRTQFNERHKLTVYLAEDIRKDIATNIDGRKTVFEIDSKPVRSVRWHEPSAALWRMTIRKAHRPKATVLPNRYIML